VPLVFPWLLRKSALLVRGESLRGRANGGNMREEGEEKVLGVRC